MSMRLQEVHPALVHFPITLLPVTLGVDLLGRATRNRVLLDLAAKGMVVTAGSAVGAAAAGLLAQESAVYDEESHDMLVTHRNLNLGLIALTTLMAARRRGRAKPSLRYLLAGLGGVLVMTYSAYLGGKMVYERGVGVKAAGSLREHEAPELLPGNAGEIAQVSARHVRDGVRDAVGTLARGEIVPWLTRTDAEADEPEPVTAL